MTTPSEISNDCLTLEELRAWADEQKLSEDRLEHLNACVLCQAMGEQIHTFDPEASARRVVQAMPDSLKTAPPKGLRALDWAALASVFVLLLVAFGLWRYAAGETQALAFETRRTRFLESDLAASTQQVQQLSDQIDALHQSVAALPKTEPLSVAAKGLVNKIDTSASCSVDESGISTNSPPSRGVHWQDVVSVSH